MIILQLKIKKKEGVREHTPFQWAVGQPDISASLHPWKPEQSGYWEPGLQEGQVMKGCSDLPQGSEMARGFTMGIKVGVHFPFNHHLQKYDFDEVFDGSIISLQSVSFLLYSKVAQLYIY